MKKRNRIVSGLALVAPAVSAPRARTQSTYTPYTFTTITGSPDSSGTNDGTGSDARFNIAVGVAVDTNGNVYVADIYNHTIRKVTPAGEVTTLAGLTGAGFIQPRSVVVDSAGILYVADALNDTIRKITPVGTNWVVTTLAGLARSEGSADGTGSAALFYGPWGVAVDGCGQPLCGGHRQLHDPESGSCGNELGGDDVGRADAQ